MKLATTALIVLLACGAANASGGLSCATSDEAVTFSLDGGVSRGMGGALFSFSGSIAIRARGVPVDLRRMEFTRDHVAQYRLNERMRELTIYRERPAEREHGYVEIDISTVPAGDEGGYAGTYVLELYEAAGNGRTVTRTGKVECMAE